MPKIKIYRVTENEEEIQVQGFYRMNTRKNTRMRAAMLKGLGQGTGAEERTGVGSGGGAFLWWTAARCGLLRLRWWRAAGGGSSASPGARDGLKEESERERARGWHSEGDGGLARPIYRLGWPANGAD